ncbi:MAG: FGGY family carbohydrate kinase [Victivallaceae bacterium]|nr:FGGY family carbohydrate kinase [Victivallaceae bacterium]
MAIFLGLDSSTQGLKAELINTEAGKIICSCGVNFGNDLPEYQCPSGFLENSDPLIRHADPLVWAAALDLLFERLAAAGAPLAQVAGISGSGQQHGSVYLNESFSAVLAGLETEKTLAEQLQPTRSRNTSPIWMDRATSAACAELNGRFGNRIQLDTGSPATERFTGPQIRKFAEDEPDKYQNTAHIHLVSSFMASLLCGANAPIDYGDGAGMNLLNLKTLRWDEEIVEFTASGLPAKLPPAVPSDTIAGRISPYFGKYGFKPEVPVVVWSGDNPSSLIGMGAAKPGVAVISLGTSDTFFAAMNEFKTDPEGFGHVFGNPAGGFMSLICFTNGSLAREKVKTECGLSWDEFDAAAAAAAPGSEGNLMLPYFAVESTPLILRPGIKLSGSPEFCSGKAAAPVKVRVLLEAQALTMKLHSNWIGEKFERIRITGGASDCSAFRQILADVFQSPVERISVSDSAGLGAALRAANAVENIPFEELFEKFSATTAITPPVAENAPGYETALRKYAELEKS